MKAKDFIKLLSIGILLVLITSCSGSKFDYDDTDIPIYVFKNAEKYIASKTGENFFENYIQPDFDNCTKVENGYFLVYKLYVPEKPFVKGDIRFIVDTLGNVNNNFDVFGIPECVKNPGDCKFSIDEKSARAIAEQHGLEKGIKDWKLSFIYDPVYGKYVWNINSTLTENEGEFGYRASGQEMIIDSSTGEVLSKNDWKIN
ncbi:MAG: PepSY domain-containing protein [Ignavibacterium sp.]|jgi:hypothetical protein|uniref:hypothetical protein n=1 Tax=Ignavibacterium sp. TaxID=2651167 RepID=UPI0032986733